MGIRTMKKNINLLGIIFVLISFFAFSGLDCESGGIELRVVGTGGSFDGYYVINGGDEVFFTGSLNNGLYRFSKDLGTFRFVEITATKDNVSAAMDIYLYDVNGNLIQKTTNSGCFSHYTTCSNTVSSTMSYTFRR